jgi:hypothetical protein
MGSKLQEGEVRVTEDTSGRKKYYKPDGTEVWDYPVYHDRINTKTRKLVGKVDANIVDKGWSLSPPQELKLYCKHCTKYHDTGDQIKACKETRDAQAKYWEERVRGERGDNRSEIDELKEKIDMLTELITEMRKK